MINLWLQIDSFAQSLAVDGAKARELSKIGQELLQDHNFALDCVQPKCSELKMMCQKLELLLTEKRRMLHKFLDLVNTSLSSPQLTYSLKKLVCFCWSLFYLLIATI